MNWLTRLVRRPHRSTAVTGAPAAAGVMQVLPQPAVTRAAVAEGWNGVPWGAPLDAFREAFPGAQPNGTWWVTGQGPEVFCGIEMGVQYAFNERRRCYMVAFYPDPADRVQVPARAIDHLGAPEGNDLRWTVGAVVVEVKAGGIAMAITHTGFAGR